MGQHDLPDDVMFRKAAAGAQRLLQHLSEPRGHRGDARTANDFDELVDAVRELRRLTEILEKESASQ